MSKNGKHYLKLFQKAVFRDKMFRWTRWLQFSQPSRKLFARRPNVFRSLLKTIRTHKIVLKKKHFSSKVSCGNVHFSFGNPAGSLLTKNGTSSLKKRKLWEIYSFFRKKFNKMTIGTCRILFLQPEIFCSSSKNDKKVSFSKKFSSK